MTVAASVSLRSYAAEHWPLINHKGRIAQLARLLSWGYRRIRAVYNAEDGVALRAGEQADIDRLTREARDEHRHLERRIAALEALLFGAEEAFYRDQVEAQVAYARGRLAGAPPEGEGIREGREADAAGGDE